MVARTLWDGRLVEIVEDAFERVQISPSSISGEQLTSAMRSLSFQLINWSANLNHAWSVEEETFPLSKGQQTITLPVGALGVAEGVYRDVNSLDTPVGLVSREEWSGYPDKNIIGDRPTHLWVDKKHNVDGARQLTVHMWQLPGHDDGSLVLNLIMTAQDTPSLGEAPEVPQTWIDALCAALAWRLAMKFKPELEGARERHKVMAYNEAMGSTAERTPFRMTFENRSRYR